MKQAKNLFFITFDPFLSFNQKKSEEITGA